MLIFSFLTLQVIIYYICVCADSCEAIIVGLLLLLLSLAGSWHDYFGLDLILLPSYCLSANTLMEGS